MKRLRGLVVLMFVLAAHSLTNAQSTAVPAQSEADSVRSAAGDSASTHIRTSLVSPDELFNRLEQNEARIQALESELASARSSGGSNGLGRIANFVLLSAHDPEIAIVREQTAPIEPAAKSKKWYEKIGLRGYTQLRFSETVYEDDDSAPAHHVGDRSVNDNQTFLIRRARLILSGDVSDHVYIYLQPDFAVTPPGSSDSNHFTQIRDWYADIYLDKQKEYRIRVGQSKIPYGWENMQSSSNRLPLDRADALNSAVKNERDLGAIFYYTPEFAQKFFREVLDEGLKGSGNYGLFAFGAYAGQGGSLAEQNDELHLVTRLTFPMVLENGQRLELATQAYTGKYVVLSSPIRALGAGASIRPSGTLEMGETDGILDKRIAWTAVWYPQPFGLQAEWTVGRGPALNDDQDEVEERALYGGYVMAMYKIDDCYGTWLPFVRWSYYRGGYKSERNSPFSAIDDWELGVEWQITPSVELSMMYAISDRTNTTAVNQAGVVPYEQFDGHLLRFQLQFNY